MRMLCLIAMLLLAFPPWLGHVAHGKGAGLAHRHGHALSAQSQAIAGQHAFAHHGPGQEGSAHGGGENRAADHAPPSAELPSLGREAPSPKPSGQVSLGLCLIACAMLDLAVPQTLRPRLLVTKLGPAQAEAADDAPRARLDRPPRLRPSIV